MSLFRTSIDEIYYKYHITALQPDEEEEVRDIMPAFLFYRREKGGIDFYCTACHERYYRPKCEFTGGSAALSHKEQGLCPVCGEAVQFRCMNYGRTTLRHWTNVVLIRPENESVCLDCCGVMQYFSEDDMEPQYDAFVKEHIELRPGAVSRKVVRWIPIGGYDWVEVKSIREPHFVTLPFGGSNNTYTLIGEDKLDGTFLKYAMTADTPSVRLSVTYLCKYALHPNIEYLMKGGFKSIVTALCEGRSGIRVNWKSNDLKKMLRLNRTELRELKDLSAEDYRSYIIIRKHLPGLSTEAVIDYWDIFHGRKQWRDTISESGSFGLKNWC